MQQIGRRNDTTSEQFFRDRGDANRGIADGVGSEADQQNFRILRAADALV